MLVPKYVFNIPKQTLHNALRQIMKKKKTSREVEEQKENEVLGQFIITNYY